MCSTPTETQRCVHCCDLLFSFSSFCFFPPSWIFLLLCINTPLSLNPVFLPHLISDSWCGNSTRASRILCIDVFYNIIIIIIIAQEGFFYDLCFRNSLSKEFDFSQIFLSEDLLSLFVWNTLPSFWIFLNLFHLWTNYLITFSLDQSRLLRYLSFWQLKGCGMDG